VPARPPHPRSGSPVHELADLFVEPLLELVEAFAGLGGDGVDLDAFEALLEVDEVFLRLGEVDLVGDDAPGALRI
jgi:hypothetical protein